MEKDYVTSLRHQLTAPSGNTPLYLSFSVYVHSSFQRPMGPTVINQFLVVLRIQVIFRCISADYRDVCRTQPHTQFVNDGMLQQRLHVGAL